MKHPRNCWREFAATSVVFGLMVAATSAAGPGGTIQRPLRDFLAAQGTACVDDGAGGCYLFVPPDPNFLGWNTDLSLPVIYFAGVDYAGLANAYAPGKAPSMSGTVIERPLPDGTAEVRVLLQTKNANVWVIDIDLSGDVGAEIAGKATLFGHRPAEVEAGMPQALADSVLQAVFVIAHPGDPLPDLMTINGTPALKFIAFQASGVGPLNAPFGVPDGTPGRCKITQTGLVSVPSAGWNHGFPDGFPVENIRLSVVGR